MWILNIFLLFSLHSNVEDSVPIPREAAVTLIDKNGIICSRLFAPAEKSIVKVRA